jgi:hypothetical protein
MSLRRLGKALIGVRKNRNENSAVKPHYISRRAGKHEKTSKESYITLPLSLDWRLPAMAVEGSLHARDEYLPRPWQANNTAALIH